MTLKQMYTTKQIEVLKTFKRDDWFLRICDGAIRSGKTVVDNDDFLLELKRVRRIADEDDVAEPMYILAGFSSKTIQQNILQELTNRYGIVFKFDKHGSFTWNGVKIVLAYTGSIAGLGGIRGMTSYGAYVNEASLANEQVFQEIIQRCSGRGARIIADTNPDNPGHWLKKNYIDNPANNILRFHFRLADNTFLTQQYIDNIIATTPSGMFTDRGIEGLWVAGEGAVYRDFTEQDNVIDQAQVPIGLTHYAGVDWGFEHKGCIVVEGDSSDGKTYQVYENTKQYKQIDYWVSVAKKLQAKYGKRMPFYCDSARPDYVSRFRQEGINAINANKTRLSGVEMVAGKYKTNQLLIVKQAIDKLLTEIYEYVWDESTGGPQKLNDDVMDAQRYAIYTQHHQGAVIKSYRL